MENTPPLQHPHVVETVPCVGDTVSHITDAPDCGSVPSDRGNVSVVDASEMGLHPTPHRSHWI